MECIKCYIGLRRSEGTLGSFMKCDSTWLFTSHFYHGGVYPHWLCDRKQLCVDD